MAETDWELKVKSFLKKAGEEFKRAGADIKQETQRLVTEVQDAQTQARVRGKLQEVGEWAKKTGEELSVLLDQGVKKAEVALSKAGDKVRDFAVTPSPEASATGTKAKAAAPEAAPDETPKPAKKTVGKGTRKSGGKKGGSPKKTVGKKRPAPTEPPPQE